MRVIAPLPSYATVFPSTLGLFHLVQINNHSPFLEKKRHKIVFEWLFLLAFDVPSSPSNKKPQRQCVIERRISHKPQLVHSITTIF